MVGSRQVGAAMVLAGALGVPAIGADEVGVTVHVENYASVPAGEWAMAQREVEEIYRAAGIALQWAGPLRVPMDEVPRDGIRRVALVLAHIREPFAGSEQDTAEVLGRAVPAISRAWIFVNRVAEMTKFGSIDARRLLARVVAHELGHVLLESRAHAPYGIMRAGLELSEVGFNRFTGEHAALMRDGIRRHVGQ